MQNSVLILTKSFFPHRVVNLRKSMNMVFSNRIHNVLETTDEKLGTIPYSRISEFLGAANAYRRTPGDNLGDLVINTPLVMSTNRKSVDISKDVKFTRSHVYKRDDFTCQYCGKRDSVSNLNYDHIIPRSMGGKKCWSNIVTSCYLCNMKKGNRTPDQAGMKLEKNPSKPSWHSMVLHDIVTEFNHETWTPYISGYL